MHSRDRGCQATASNPDTTTLYESFTLGEFLPRRAFMPLGCTDGSGDRRINVTDLIVVVLSTGGILLMAGYAVLCDRI
jgi:hypothetical protein